MKLVYFVGIFVLCVGMKTSNADSGKSIQEKRKFVSMSNRAKEDALVQCKSGKENYNKTLKPGEKIRWGVAEKGESMICSVDIRNKRGVHGYFSAFLAKYCKKECKWRFFDDGMLNLKLGGGEWKSFKLKEGPAPPLLKNNVQEKSPAPAPSSGKAKSTDAETAPTPMNRDQGKSKSGAPTPPPANQIEKAPAPAPSKNAKTAPSPTNQQPGHSPKGKSPVPVTAPAPANDKTKSAPPPTKQIKKGPPPAPAPLKMANTAPPPMKSESPAAPVKAPAPTIGKPKSGAISAPSPTKQINKAPAPAPLKNAKTSPPPTKQSKPTNSPKWKSPAPAPANDHKTISGSKSAPPPTKQIKTAPAPVKWISAPPENAETAPPTTEHGRRKLKHGHPSKSKPPVPDKAAAPPRKLKTVEALPPTKQDAKLAPPPSPPQNTPTEGGEESEGPDPESSPPARPRSTFYSCIKEDLR